jgi:hypothetical protein
MRSRHGRIRSTAVKAHKCHAAEDCRKKNRQGSRSSEHTCNAAGSQYSGDRAYVQ